MAAMRKAEYFNVFERLPHRSQCSWNALITCQIKSGMSQQALTLYQQMPKDDTVRISGHTYVTLLKACTKLKDLKQGFFIHADVARSGLLECDLFISNTLIDLYAKLGLLEKAQQVFDRLPGRDVISWTALIAGYVEHAHGEIALKCFEIMKQEGVPPNAVTYICILKACGSLKATNKGREVHNEMERQKLLGNDLFVCSTLVDMYAKCGLLNVALQLFDKLPFRDVVSWTALVAGYVEHGYAEQALNYFEQMQLEGVSPNSATFVCILKACGSSGAINRGSELHAVAEREGFLKEPLVVNTLIDMYVKLGFLAFAQEVFEKLTVRDVVSWTALIAGYVEAGQGFKALECYEQMVHNGVSPNPVTFVFSLKACGCMGAVDRGWKFHSEIERRGFLKDDAAIGNTLVDMYAKCGSLSCAQQVFEKLSMRNVVSFNALITAFSEHGYGSKALEFFERMHCEGVTPDTITYVYGLKSCGNIGATVKGSLIHAEIERQGLINTELVIGNTLIEMYIKCGSLAMARQVFDKLPSRNAVSWNVLMAGYTEHGHGDKALACIEEMQSEGVHPSPVSFICTLKACASTGITDLGKELHSKIERQGLFEGDIVIGNSLVTMYAKCGLLARAQQVFDKLPVQNVTSWNALMTGYAEHGYGRQVLNYFEEMQLHGVWPNTTTRICSLKACGILRDAERGQEMHAEAESYGLLQENIAAGNTVVRMYGKCGSLDVAHQVFNDLQLRGFVSWAALTAGYHELGYGEEVLCSFDQMLQEGFCPTPAAFACYVKSCASLKAIDKGRNSHAEIERLCLLGSNPILGNGLIDMYVKSGLLARAQEVFDNLQCRDVVAWNSIIAGLVDHGLYRKALKFLNLMQLKGVLPDALTFASCLRACEAKKALTKGKQLHTEITSLNFLNQDIVVLNALVHMYAKCGLLSKAQFVYDNYQVPSIALGNALMEGYIVCDQSGKALESFECLQLKGACPDARSFVCSLNACRDIGAIRKGKELHAEVEKRGLLNEDVVGNTLISMYAKCGCLVEACQVFNRLRAQDVVSWTALMSGYAELGQTADVLESYHRMSGKGIQPDAVSLLVALKACGLSGLLGGDVLYFEGIAKQCGIALTLEHYSCIVKFFSHAGKLDAAVNILGKAVSCSNLPIWHTLLGACKNVGSEEYGLMAFRHTCVSENIC